MDKIITINLGGYSIKIEEDAYELLKNYILLIEKKFAQTENGKEIINDIEARIAEMLIEKLDEKIATNLADVNHVKLTMGDPGQFDDTENSDTGQQTPHPSETTKKRLYRDSDNKLLGGVCSGLSNYFNIDPSILRLIWVCLIFIFGTGVLLYFILWIILPEAVTTAQKLEMNGEAPTFDNIINRVKNEAEKIEQNLKSKNSRHRLAEIIESLGHVFITLFKVLASLIGLATFLLLFFVLIALISGGTSFLIHDHGVSMNHFPNVFDAFWEFLTFKFLIGLFICIPLFAILTGVLKFVFHSDVNYKPLRRTLGWIWVATIPFLLYFIFSAAKNFTSNESISIKKTEIMHQPLCIKGQLNESDYFFDNISISISPSEDTLLHINYIQSANGQNPQQAKEMAQRIGACYLYSGNELILKSSDYFEKTKLFRHQKIEFSIQIPNGKTFTIDPSLMKTGIRITAENMSLYPDESDNRNNPLMFIQNNLYCPSCTDSLPLGSSSSVNFKDFNRIEAEGMIDLEIHQGRKFSIQKSGPKDILSHLEIEQYGHVIQVRMDANHYYFKTKPKVIITMPEIESLKISGTSECVMDRFAGNSFYFEGNGASNAKLSLDFAEIQVDMSGVSQLDLSGTTKNIAFDMSGASHSNVRKLLVENAKIDLSGACELYLGKVRNIQGESSGACVIEYEGEPVLQVNSSGISKIKRRNP